MLAQKPWGLASGCMVDVMKLPFFLFVLWVACTVAACGGETLAVQEGSGTAETNPIKVLIGPKVVYSKDEGAFAFAVIKNTTDQQLRVDGQYSFKDKKGLAGTADATTTVLPGQQGVLIGWRDPLRPFKTADVDLVMSVSEGWASEAFQDPAAITIKKASWKLLKPQEQGGWKECRFAAIVTNNTQERQPIQVLWVGLKNGKPVTAAYALEDLFPGTPKIVMHLWLSDTLCPKGGVDEVRAFWEPPNS